MKRINTTLKPSQLLTHELMAKSMQERGIKPQALEVDLLLQRIKARGHSGLFLANAFISAYRTNEPFNHSLGELIRLDNEGIRLFHQILHIRFIRFIRGWSDDELYAIEQRINELSLTALQTKEVY